MDVLDALKRPLRSLRISVTDRCNIRCAYCMSEEDYVWLPREGILGFEEIGALVDAFSDCGVDRVRLTGGEPLLRRELPELVRLLAAKPAIRDLAVTTNGVLLAPFAAALKEAGLHRVTVSLDTLRPDVFEALTRRATHGRVLEGLAEAARAGFTGTKIDSVIMRGVNDGEICDLIEFARDVPAEVRFIEYMDVGGATRWSREAVFTRAEMIQRIEARYGRVTPLRDSGSAPADRFALADGAVFGVISATTAPFCRSCDRSRLTADGLWYLCLYASRGTDLRGPLRAGADRDDLRAIIARGWSGRNDRGAEDRLAQIERGPLIDRRDLRLDPHLEMHTRGG